ncbi:nucleoside-diphosphate sugar epimerase [Streptomyces sp. CS227]|uniref:SDR family oxidoreductase n=1 Tax=Streptomyces sp. CS227 TaxID=1982763 RepID=UPI000B40B8C1|nr:SDR family oxidoreductase [Streptomyces sp. CS227]OWA03140.1 nucleoside-diphosphate sugar epimerase [Streptomyces sp. CS227]
MTTILVTGGTGKLGRPLVARLREGGQDVRVLSRRDPHHPVDLRKGQGLDAALAGVGTVVHCASSPMGGDAEAAGNLLAAAGRAGVEHLVYISIVGVDQIPYPYYRVKHQVERMVEESGIGWTVLRATQFHDLVRSVLRALGRPPVMVLPKGLKDQPVAVEEVAGRLAELALGGPAGRVADLGGPEVRDLESLADAWEAASGRGRKRAGVPLAGRAYRAFREGRHLAPDGDKGSVTFEEFLAERGA